MSDNDKFPSYCPRMIGTFGPVSSASIHLILLGLIVTSSLSEQSRDDKTNIQHSPNDTISYQDEFWHQEQDSTLLLVQVVFRHGDRSPLYTFPTDSHQDDWPQGYGQLTELGMTQSFELGQFLTRRYSGFLGQNYQPEEVQIQSSDSDRTLMTAQCVAAGLFSRNPETGTKHIPWQPVPVHTMPRPQDKMLSPDKACTYVKDLKYGLKAYFYSQRDIMKDKRMMFALSRYSGLVMNFTTLHNLADTLFCQKVHNMSLPTWFDETMETELFSFYHRLPVLMPEEAKYLAGILLEAMIDNMVHKADHQDDKHKLYLYSAHQGNLHSLMSLLGVFSKDTTIPYASAVIVELHRIHHKLFVKLLYKTSDASVSQVLHIPGCKSDLCPLSALNDLYEEPARKTWQDMCGLSSHENVIDFGEDTIPILVAALVVFICLDFFLLYKTFRYRQRLHSKNGKEAYALVRTDDGSSDTESDLSNDAADDEDDNIELDNGTKSLLTKSYSDKKRSRRSPRQHSRLVANGAKRLNGTTGEGKGTKDRESDNSDSYEETALFVAPSNLTK